MARRVISYHQRAAAGDTLVEPTPLQQRFAAIRAALDVPGDFPPEVLAEAAAAGAAAADLPGRDETSAPFLTVDPPGSLDLDQAMLLERDGAGYRVRYAIADVPAFVAPGGALDAESRRRGQTIYCPDLRVPLHPPVLSDGAASLLPGETRPAFVWDMRLNSEGDETGVEVYRAMVRSRDRLDYAGVQQAIDGGTDDERLVLLKEIGTKRIELERARGGASLPMPEQEVTDDGHGNFVLAFRPALDAEDWNAQISLMTGMAAAEMMLHGQVGILRTMPPPDHGAVNRFRRQARALGVTWPAEALYGDFLRSLDRTNPKHLALIHEATALFRGAGYTPFEGAVPEVTLHAAVAAPYAHVTAPLRRLVDRFGLVICESLSSGADVPTWVRQALTSLPAIMVDSDRRASAVDRACTDAAEAAAMASRVGQTFAGSVVDLNDGGMPVVQLFDPAIVAQAAGHARAGDEVRVTVTGVDVGAGTMSLQVVPG